jgi:hypothetical protein
MNTSAIPLRTAGALPFDDALCMRFARAMVLERPAEEVQCDNGDKAENTKDGDE